MDVTASTVAKSAFASVCEGLALRCVDLGLLSFVRGSEWIFDVTATDAEGNALTGQIVIASG